MLLLPKKVGSYTLQRKLGTGGVAESYVGTHDTNGAKAVVVRRILPYVQRDPARLASIDGRVKDLLGVRHPFLVHVLESFAEGDEHYIVEEHVDGVNLEKVLAWCRQHGRQVPHNVFLNIATQVCNGLEALHGRTGKGSSAEHVLHLSLKPNAVFITRDGKVMVGGYGLTRSPTTLPHGGVAGPVPTRMEYLSPEQTHPDQKLTPASDIFALGAVLYELLTLDSLFRADSNLQTIHRVRRAEVTAQLLRVKELMPGLDKVLYRALSLNPRHRYQRAFVLREDLRGLMAGYSFATIAEDTRTFLGPLLDATNTLSLSNAQDAPEDADSFADSPITHVDLDPMTTAAAAAQAVAAARVAPPLPPAGEFAGEHTENTSPRGNEDPPTEVRREPEPSEELDRPTLPGVDVAPEGTLPVGRYAPPDPTVSQPDLSRVPPPPPLPIAPRVAAETVAADRERTEREQEAPPLGREWRPVAEEPENTAAYLNHEPESTAAHIAREAPPIVPFAGNPSPSDTAAYLARPPVAPSGPVESEPAAAVPPPPVFTPPPPVFIPPPVAAAPTPVAPPPAPPAGFSRAMPGPTGAFNRPMPPPGSSLPPSSLQPPPKPVAPIAPPPMPAAARTPTAVPEPLGPAPTPVRPPEPRPVQVAPALDPLYDEPPASGGGKAWLFAVGGLAALVALFACSGAAWMGWRQMTAPSTVAETPTEAPAPSASTPGDAASIMADAAPPRVEPIVDDAVADATPPTPPPTEPTPAPPPPTPVATPPAAEPVATRSSTGTPTSSSTRSTTSAPAPTTTRTTTSPPPTTRSSEPAPTTSTRTTASTSTPKSTSMTPKSTTSAPATTTTTSRQPVTTTATRQPVATTTRTPAPTAFEPVVDVSVEETPASDLDQFVDAAKKGKLASTDTAILEGIDAQAPDYTRSRALLLMNAQRKGDDKATRSYLDQLMVLPENQYNPVYLTDYARWHVNHAEYDKALDKASQAERYWARIPPELVFSKKAEIYEIQAAAWQGKFYKSDEDMDLLGSAIKGWERYRQHVSTKSRTDLQKRADTELARLQDIREKLQ